MVDLTAFWAAGWINIKLRMMLFTIASRTDFITVMCRAASSVKTWFLKEAAVNTISQS